MPTVIHAFGSDGALSRGAAEALEDLTGVAAGGTTGQVLTKTSDADYDTEWADPSGGGGGGAVTSVAGRTGAVVLAAADVSNSTATGRALITAADAAAARSTVGAAAFSHQHWAEDIFRGGGAPLPLDTIPTGITGSTVALGNHTHASASITDLTEAVQDIVGAFIKAGTGTTVAYDDAANSFTITATGGTGGATDPEIVRDVIGAALVAGSGVQLTVNDAGDTITVASTAVLPTRQVVAGTGLSGGGDLSVDRTLSVQYGATAGTAAQGNDSRLSNARTPTAHKASHASGGSDALTPADIGAVAASLVDAKGDLLAATADNTMARVGVGSNGQVLTADSAVAAGVKWATPAGGSSTDVPNVRPSGVYLAPPGYNVVARNVEVPLINNMARYFPMRLEAPLTISSTGIQVVTAVAGSTIHLALYNDPANNLQPGTRIAAPSGAGFSGATAAVVEASGLTISLNAGNYVWVLVATGGAPSLRGQSIAVNFLSTTIDNNVLNRLERASATVPPPASGEAWTSATGGTALFSNPIFIKGA